MKTTQLSQPASAAPNRTTMQAIVQRRHGTQPEEVLGLEQVAMPAIAANEVLVQVRAAGLDRGHSVQVDGQTTVKRSLRLPQSTSAVL